MKLLGHVYVAVTAFPNNNQELLAFGALLPETVFYTKPQVLTYDQIHEGGLTLYQYCQTNYPDYADLAIGSMTHSKKYGADSFNSLESLIPLGYNKNDIPLISDALGLSNEIAQARVHNLYDLVIDYYINQKYPQIRQIVENTKNLNTIKISQILAECYKVNAHQVFESLSNLWKKYDLSLMDSFEGLATFWKLLASDLKEKDPVDIERTSILLSDFYMRLENTADEFLDEVVNKTKDSVTAAIA